MSARHEPWIGDCTDGSRQIVRVYDDHGVCCYYTVRDILDSAPAFASGEHARKALDVIARAALREQASESEVAH